MTNKHLWKVTVVQPSTRLENIYKMTEKSAKPDFTKLGERTLKIAVNDKDAWNFNGILVLRVTSINYEGTIDG